MASGTMHNDRRIGRPNRFYNNGMSNFKNLIFQIAFVMVPSAATRAIVKNLPKDLDENGLRGHLSSINCPITDLKLIRTSQGISRRFAFVGFETAEDTSRAVLHFNNTFIGTIKITIEPVSTDASRPVVTTRSIPSEHEKIKKKEAFLSFFFKGG